MHKKDKIMWLLVILGSALAVFIPFIFYRFTLGEWLPDIFTQLESDSVYYLTHIQKMLRGQSMGNAYFLEYADTPYPGLYFPIFLSAIPGFLGLSLNGIYVFNTLFYGVLTGAILYLVSLRVTNRAQLISAIIAIVGVASLSNLILRPVIMQTVYPVFGLFMLALLNVLEQPGNKRRFAELGIMCVIAFYLYPHLWMQNFTSVGLLFLFGLWKRDRQMLQWMTLMGIGVIVACLPQILTTISLFSDPMALAINRRSGLVETHAVLPLTIMNNKYVIVVVVGLLLLRTRKAFTSGEALLVLLGSAVVIAATSNVITGKEMDFVSHPWRLGLMVNVIAIGVLFSTLRSQTDRFGKVIAGTCLALMIFTTGNRVFIRKNPYGYMYQKETIQKAHAVQQGYRTVFDFLNANGTSETVILTNASLGFISPLYTESSVLYVARAGLQVVPDAELLERFLVFHVDDVNNEYLRKNVDLYAGVGADHYAVYANAYPGDSFIDDAKSFALGLIGKSKLGTLEQIDFIGGEEFLKGALELHRTINRNYAKYLKKYHVQYIIVDSESEWNPRPPTSTQIVLKDERFIIYEVN